MQNGQVKSATLAFYFNANSLGSDSLVLMVKPGDGSVRGVWTNLARESCFLLRSYNAQSYCGCDANKRVVVTSIE